MHFKWAHLSRLLRLLFGLVLIGLLLSGGLILGSNPISNETRCRIPFIATLDGGGLRLGGLSRGGLSLGDLILGGLLRDGLRLGGLPRGGLSLGDLILGRLLRDGLRLGGFVLPCLTTFLASATAEAFTFLVCSANRDFLGA